MKVYRLLIIILLMMFQGGCAYLMPKEKKPIQAEMTGPPEFLQYDLKTIALFSGYIAGLSSFERVIECDKLLSGEAGDISSFSIRLHTALVMMLTPECGGPEKALLIYESLQDKVSQKELKSLVRFQSALANRLIARSERSEILKQQINSLTKKNDLLKKQLKAKENELGQLKATLDALKQIEKTFHQRNEVGGP